MRNREWSKWVNEEVPFLYHYLGVEKNEEDDGVENKRDDVDCGLGDFETRPIFVGVMEKGIVCG